MDCGFSKAIYTIRQLWLAVMLVGCSSTTNRIEIVNNADELLTKVIVSMCSTQLTVDNIPPHSSEKRLIQRLSCESHYTVDVYFSGGKRMQKNVGYITPGIDMGSVITVKNDDVSFEYIR